MDVGDYVFGTTALAIGLLPWIPASRRLVRRIVPDWEGPAAVLAAALVGTTGVIVVAELVGLVSLFRRWPWAIVSALIAAVVAAKGTPAPPREQRAWSLPASRGAWVMLGCVVVCVMATSASVIGRNAAVLQTGPLDTDSVHYHLTQAAHMVQTHSLVHQHHTAASDGTVYYPFDAELLDAIAMLGPRPDIATYGLNLLFGWLALLACWVIGARWSAGAPALAAGAAVMALPLVAQASTGPGLNDLPSMAFVLAAVACLAVSGVPRGQRPRGRWLAELAMAGLALGLAAGTKLTTLPLAVLIFIAVVVLSAGVRGRAALALFAPAFLAGGFWYVRDWVIVGSPLPDLDLTIAGHGFPVVPYPEVEPYAFNVAHYLGDGAIIRDWFLPGLRTVWTELWPLFVLLLLLAVVLSLFTERSGFRRLLGAAVAIAILGYLVTPTTAIGPEGHPVLFATNTRYLLPVLIIAAVMVACASVLRRFALGVTVFFTAVVVVLLALEDLPQQLSLRAGIAGALILAVLVAWLAAARLDPTLRPARTVLVTGVVVVAVVGGGAVQREYLDHRYAGPGDLERLFAHVGSYEGKRIGIAGHGLQYGFFGPHFNNAVNYVGVTAPSDAFDLPQTCPELLSTLNRLQDDYVVVEPLEVINTDRIDRWISAIPGVEVVFANPAGTVYRMPTVIPSDGCSSAPEPSPSNGGSVG